MLLNHRRISHGNMDCRTVPASGTAAWFQGLLPLTLQSYLELLDWTGRELRAGTHGVIPQSLESILDRLQVSAESWLVELSAQD